LKASHDFIWPTETVWKLDDKTLNEGINKYEKLTMFVKRNKVTLSLYPDIGETLQVTIEVKVTDVFGNQATASTTFMAANALKTWPSLLFGGFPRR